MKRGRNCEQVQAIFSSRNSCWQFEIVQFLTFCFWFMMSFMIRENDQVADDEAKDPNLTL